MHLATIRYHTTQRLLTITASLHSAPSRCMLGFKRMKANLSEPARRVELVDYILADPELLGGEPVFRGTRVPVATLFEHLESGCSLDEFVECFPSVSREAAVAVLMGAEALAVEKVRG